MWCRWRSGSRCNDKDWCFPDRPLPRPGSRHTRRRHLLSSDRSLRLFAFGLLGRFLDRNHIRVGKAEMMTDLMYQHMFDDGAERLVVLGPIVENWTTIEPNHVRHLHGGALRTERQANALKQAEQVEFGFGAHLIEHVVGGEIVDPNDDIGGEIAKALRQAPKHLAGQDFKFCQRGRLGSPPGERIGDKIGHNGNVAWIELHRSSPRKRGPGCWIPLARE